MTVNIGGGGDVGNGDGDKVVTFPTAAEERRALRKAKQDRERQRLVNVFIDEAGGDQALFRTPDNIAYADLIITGHRETWPVKSLQFRYAYVRYLHRQRDQALDFNPMMALVAQAGLSKAAITRAIDDFEMRAMVSGIVREVHVRVAEHSGDIYVDLGDSDWTAVRVTTAGWSVVEAPPVRFVRTDGTRPLPRPTHGTSIEALRPFINVVETDFWLVVAFMLAALRPRGPYPCLFLYGEHGLAKTNLLKRLRALIDPTEVMTGPLPPSGRDLFIAARNSHLQAFENVSKLSDLMSDHLSRLATGTGYRQRRLFTDMQEILIRVCRPIACEGIANIVSLPDLQSRSIILKPAPISAYLTESELLAQFEQRLPGIFGALLDMMVRGLANLPHTRADRKFRMADFATWSVACKVPDFERLYAANIQDATETLLSLDPVALAIRNDLLKRRKSWQGTMSDLLDAIGPLIRYKEPNHLSNALRRLTPALKRVGVQVIREDRRAEHRPFRIERAS